MLTWRGDLVGNPLVSPIRRGGVRLLVAFPFSRTVRTGALKRGDLKKMIKIIFRGKPALAIRDFSAPDTYLDGILLGY